MHFPFIPTFGVSATETDALSVLADAQYVYVRHFNSGSRNYGASDLFQYELATISVYLLYAYCRKALGISKLFDKYNRVLGKSLAEVNHIDLDNIRANSKDFTAWLNLFRDKLSTYVIPGDIAILPRWFSLTEGIIADDYTEGQTKQLYDFSPALFYKYDWENSALIPINYVETYADDASHLTFENLRTLAQDLLGQLQNSDDVGTISGDLLKAYGDNVYKLTPTTEDYVSPVVRATNELLAYIKNADLILHPLNHPSPVSEGTSWEYRQRDTIIEFTPVVGVGTIRYVSFKYLGSEATEYSVLTDVEEADTRNVVTTCFNNVYTGKRVVDFLSDSPSENEKAAALLSKFTLQTDSHGKLIETSNTNIVLQTSTQIQHNSNIRYYQLQRCGSEILCMPELVIVQTNNDVRVIYTEDFFNMINLYHFNGTSNTSGLPFDATDAFIKDVSRVASLMSYANQFDCMPHYFTAICEAVNRYGLRVFNSYPGSQHDIDSTNGYMHNETHNVKYIPTEAIEYALESYCWDNLVNDLWLKRSK
nr:putative capsid protein [Picobirnavirus sp.]